MKRLVTLLCLLLAPFGCSRAREPVGKVAEPEAGQPVGKVAKPEAGQPHAEITELGPARTAAFLDLNQSPVGALVEARLTKHPNLIWVERASITEIFKEQRLQAAFGPQASPDRVALGKLLKADLLILLQTTNTAQKEGNRGHLVVCETRYGLRLCSQAVDLGQNAATLAADLEQAILQTIRRHADKITRIVAVPPFVSNDLGAHFDHLKAAYAKVIEGALLEHKGTVVVELGEAQAVGRERDLDKPGENVERQLPYYFLGEYRNEGKTKDRRVTIRLRLMQGEALVGKQEKSELTPEDAPTFLVEAAVQLSAGLAAGSSRVEPGAEARQLAARASTFRRLGDWDEALALVEASLLLDFQQPKLHNEASMLCGLISQRETAAAWFLKPNEVPRDVCVDRRFRALNSYRRGLQHLETYLTTRWKNFGEYKLNLEIQNGRMNRSSSWAIFPEVKELFDNVREEEKEVLLRMIRFSERERLGNPIPYLRMLIEGRPFEEQCSLILGLILELRDLGGTRRRTVDYVERGYPVEDTPGIRSFLEQLAQAPDPEIRAAAEELKAELEASKKARAAGATKLKPAAPPPAPAAGPRELVFKSPKLTCDQPTIRPLLGWLPAGEQTDILWSDLNVYIMKEKGHLKQLWSGKMVVQRGCFDGRYFWVPIGNGDMPFLLVIDPVTEKTWNVTTEDGLPSLEREKLADPYAVQVMMAAPLGPGRVCVAGTFGRTWLALVTFDPAGEKTVKIIHEARELADSRGIAEAKAQAMNAKVAFTPEFMATLTDPGAPADAAGQRVLVGRRTFNPWVDFNPLVVDPKTLSVSVSPAKFPHNQVFRQSCIQHNGSLYFLADKPRPPDDRASLSRIAYPGVAVETVQPDVPMGWLTSRGDRVYIVAKEWWSGTLPDPRFRLVFGAAPWEFQYHGSAAPKRILWVGTSSHYGTIATIEAQQPTGRFSRTSYQVTDVQAK